MRQDITGLSTQTALFIEGLDLILQAEDKILRGYSEMYGDGCGTGEGLDMYTKSEVWEKVEEAKKALRHQIGFAMELNIGEHNPKL